MYIIYCNNYETSVETIRNCLKRKEFETICEVKKIELFFFFKLDFKFHF